MPSTPAACWSWRSGKQNPARPTRSPRSSTNSCRRLQREDGVKLFLISRAKDDPAQFLFYELFRDEAAFKAHQDSAHFKTYIAGQALPLLSKRERTQYELL
ncbi:antibiotic biosynthesis monooxygenase [Bradyrhizobium sp. ISRA435]|nr:antibiotic biosynthesis monooxygenase [Bradyrhizobium sp. ISRA435]